MKRLMKPFLAAWIVLPAVLVGTAARAGDGQATYTAPKRHDPDASVAFEIRFGPYRPQIDKMFANAAPYREVFGDSRRYMIGGEVDWQALHIKHVGSIGLGGLFGYTRASGNARFLDGTESAEDTRFSMWLLGALAVVRIDVLARETWIPLVPYGKVGLATALWSSSNGLGTSKSADGVEATGRTNGLIYAFGGMFLLDVLDRQSAKTFSAEQGVKHTYLWAEYTIVDLRGLGQKNAMQVGDTTWNFGFAFEM